MFLTQVNTPCIACIVQCALSSVQGSKFCPLARLVYWPIFSVATFTSDLFCLWPDFYCRLFFAGGLLCLMACSVQQPVLSSGSFSAVQSIITATTTTAITATTTPQFGNCSALVWRAHFSVGMSNYVKCSAVPSSTIMYSIVNLSAVQCSAVHSSAVHCEVV